MLDVEIGIRNYRCFGDEQATVRIIDGFTAFVGVNNSGKSSMLRMLYELRPLFHILANYDGTVPKFFSNGDPIGQRWSPLTLPGERAHRAGADAPIEITIIVRNGPKGQFALEGEQLIVTLWFDRNNWTRGQITTEAGTLIKGENHQSHHVIVADPLIAAMAVLADTMYIGPFRNAIHVGGQDRYYDISTGSSFVSSFASYKSGDSPTDNEAVHDLVQEIARIFGFQSLEISPGPRGETLQLMVDGRSYRLSELGAGLAHFIVVLVNVLVRRPALLLIDEPELNLHASLQLDFLTTLARYTKNGIVFATHSLGLARTAADRVYVFDKPVGKTSRVLNYDDAKADPVTLLGQLSFAGHPAMGFSQVLLVEGKTELRAVMQLLKLYKKEHEVLLIPLHGASLINPTVEPELRGLLRTSKNVQYLIDSERATEGAALDTTRQGFVDLCSKLGIKGHVLERRALEHYFTDGAIKKVCGPSLGSATPYESRKSGKQWWDKNKNWLIAANMTRADLDSNDLGQFLATL